MLVEADNFHHLMDHIFNKTKHLQFNQYKNKYVVVQVIDYSIEPCCTFFNFMDLLVPFGSHKTFALRRLHCHFWWLLDCVLRSCILKNMKLPLLVSSVMFMFGYYNEFIFVQRQILWQLILKEIWVNRYIYHTINWPLMLMTLNVSSIFKCYLDCTEALFYKIKINSYGVYVVKKETKTEYFLHY